MIELVDYANLYYFRLYIETFLSTALNGFDSLDTSRYWKEALILLYQKKKIEAQSEYSLHFKKFYFEFKHIHLLILLIFY